MDYNNQEIRDYARESGVQFWKVADELKVSEATFTRLMRKELPEDKKSEIIRIIKELSIRG